MNDKVPMIDVRHISKFFGSVIALSDVSMNVYAGEYFENRRYLKSSQALEQLRTNSVIMCTVHI